MARIDDTTRGVVDTPGTLSAERGRGTRSSLRREAHPGPVGAPSGLPLRRSIPSVIGATALVMLSACWAGIGLALGGGCTAGSIGFGMFVGAVISGFGLTAVNEWAEVTP